MYRGQERDGLLEPSIAEGTRRREKVLELGGSVGEGRLATNMHILRRWAGRADMGRGAAVGGGPGS